MSNTLFGIFHTAYERSKDTFFDFVNCNYINNIIVESNFKSEEFAISMNEIANKKHIKVWVSVTALGFKITNQVTVADTGEVISSFNPTVEVLDYKTNVKELIAYLKEKGWYDSVVGFYMDEPLLWNITNDQLEEFTGYFRKEVAPDKRFFICFSVAGIAPDVWTINDVKPITEKSAKYLTDIAFDMYHPWNEQYLHVVNQMLERTGNREDLRLWMIPCTMNYRGDKDENHCLTHLNACYEVLKNCKNAGGLMCYTYYTFSPTEEELGNIGLDILSNEKSKHYYPKLIARIKEIGKEIVSGEFDKKRNGGLL